MDTHTKEKERFVFEQVILNMSNYKRRMNAKIDHNIANFSKLSDSHKQLLPDRVKYFEDQKMAVFQNQEILKLILEDCEENFGFKVTGSVIKTRQHERVVTTLKQIMRDWSEIGERERSSSYGPILDILNAEFPFEEVNRKDIHVLTPGCGLARLTWEIFSHGFQSEGCEFSWYMILTSRFILNSSTREADESDQVHYRIHPFVHETSNMLSWRDALKEVRFPDVDPAETPEEGGDMSFGAGEFLDLYSEAKWNAVATCFFIDTAHNVIQYVEKIFQILKPGGLWINNGPLMYHFANSDEMSVELTWQELRSVIVATGFELELEDNEKCQYVENPASLLTQEFKTILFTARKPLSTAN